MTNRYKEVFGARCLVLPVTEQNVMRVALHIWSFIPPNMPFKVGTEAKVYAVSESALDSAKSADDATMLAHLFVVKYGDIASGRKEIFISQKPNLPWEDLQKMVILIPEE